MAIDDRSTADLASVVQPDDVVPRALLEPAGLRGQLDVCAELAGLYDRTLGQIRAGEP